MRKMIVSGALAAAAFLAVPAFAAGDHEDQQAPAREQISTENMKQKIENLGYDVRHLEMENGNFEVHLVEKTSGAGVKAIFQGETGELVRAELHD